MLQIRTFTIVAVLIFIHAPGAALAQREDIVPTETVIEVPGLEVEVHVAPGETIAAKARISVFQGVNLLNQIDGKQKGGSTAGRPTVLIVPQTLVALTEDKDWIYFTGSVRYKYAGVTNVTASGIRGGQNRAGGLKVRKDDPDDVEIWVSQYRGRPFVFDGPLELENTTLGADAENDSARQLVYDGVQTGTLRIKYREHEGNAPAPVYEESLTFDLSNDSVVSARGVRLEILSVDGDSLHYRVLKNFN